VRGTVVLVRARGFGLIGLIVWLWWVAGRGCGLCGWYWWVVFDFVFL